MIARGSLYRCLVFVIFSVLVVGSHISCAVTGGHEHDATTPLIRSCFPKQDGLLKRDYRVDDANAVRLRLRALHEAFDRRFRGSFQSYEYPEIKYFVQAVVDLNGKFIGPVDLTELVQNALLGAVAYASARSNQTFVLTEDGIRIGHERYALDWSRSDSVNNDIEILANFVDTLQKLRLQNPNLDVRQLVQSGIYAMYEMVGNPYTGSHPSFPEVDKAIHAKTGHLLVAKLGMTLGRKDGHILVVRLRHGFTAHEAGIKPGDRLQAINKNAVHGMSMAKVATLLEGKANLVTVERSASLGPTTYDFILPSELVYDYHRSDATTRFHLLDNKIGYIRIGAFDPPATNELDLDPGADPDVISNALAYFQIHKPIALILDLRNNPGGWLHICKEVVSNFLSADKTIYEHFSKTHPPKKVYRQHGKTVELPLVILLNAKSASASEVVAGALKHYRRAVLIGTQTFGKGTIWRHFWKPDRSAGVTITTHAWLTPARKSIDKLGVRPHVTFELLDPDNPRFSDYLEIFRDHRIDQQVASALLRTAFLFLEPELRNARKSVSARLGETYYKAKSMSRAEDAFRNALLADHLDSGAVVGLGNVYRHYEAYALADAHYQKAIQISPKNLQGYFQRGLNAMLRGSLDQARVHFDKVLALNPYYPSANYYMGITLKRKGMARQARKYLKLGAIFDTTLVSD